MEGGAALQGKAPLKLLGINTLANTMKHCINVSNYWLGGVQGRGAAIRMSHWLSITPTGVEEALPIKPAPMRRGLFGHSPSWIAWAKQRDSGEDERRSVHFQRQRMLLSHWPLKSAVAKTSVIILSTVQSSFAKATRIKRNLKAELHHGVCK